MAKIITTFTTGPEGAHKIETLDFSEEIQRGMAFLDSVRPGWESNINPALLDVSSVTACVCGQVFQNHYDEGSAALREWVAEGIDEEERDEHPLLSDIGHLAATYGFNIYESESEEYRPLEEWSYAYLEDKVDDDDEESMSEAQERVLFSTLTEQWIFEINFRRGALTPAVLSVD